MKITLERPSLMVLKDYNLSHFLGGILLIVVGVIIASFVASAGLVVLPFGGLLPDWALGFG